MYWRIPASASAPAKRARMEFRWRETPRTRRVSRVPGFSEPAQCDLTAAWAWAGGSGAGQIGLVKGMMLGLRKI